MRTIPLTRDWERSRPCTTEGWRGLNYLRPSSSPLVITFLFGPHQDLLPGSCWMEKCRSSECVRGHRRKVGSCEYYIFDRTKQRANISRGRITVEICIALEDGLTGWAQFGQPAQQVNSARKPLTLLTVQMLTVTPLASLSPMLLISVIQIPFT